MVNVPAVSRSAQAALQTLEREVECRDRVRRRSFRTDDGALGHTRQFDAVLHVGHPRVVLFDEFHIDARHVVIEAVELGQLLTRSAAKLL